MLKKLVLAHNLVAYERFMRAYVENSPHDVVVFGNSIIGAFFDLSKLLVRNRYGLILSQHPLALIFFPVLALWRANWLHFVTGQVWVTKSPLSARFFELVERVLLFVPGKKICDSSGQWCFLNRRWHGWPNIEYSGIGSMGGIEPLIYKNTEGDHDQHVLNVAWVGRDTPDKDLACALRALDSFDKGIVLYIYGISGLDTAKIKYRGFVKDLRESFLQDQIELNLVTSRREGFCMVILEAASIGVPTISSKIYGTREIIEATGMTDYMFPVGRAEELVESIATFIERDRASRDLLRRLSLGASLKYSKANVVGQFYKHISGE